MPHDNALRRAIADVLLTFEDWPQHQSEVANAERVMALNHLRAAADALAAGGEAVTVEGAWEALDRSVSSNARFANDKRVGSAMATLADLFIEIRDNATDNAARRAEEPRHD